MDQAIPTLKVLRLAEDARLPKKTHESDLGWDLYALEPITIAPGELTRVRTGIAVEFPPKIGGLIKDRSSMAAKGLHTLAGVIDPHYRGEILVVVVNLDRNPIELDGGAKIAQMILVHNLPTRIVEVDKLSETDRGAAGFGSSDQ